MAASKDDTEKKETGVANGPNASAEESWQKLSAPEDRRFSDTQVGGKSNRWVVPSWEDQRTQFLTRFLFAILGVVYFNFVFEYKSPWLSLGQVNMALGLYLLWLTVSFFHAYFKNDSLIRFRLAMWYDIVLCSIIVVNDPFVIPLTSMVYIVIVLGNGMRYGMRCFSEALVGSFIAAVLSLTLRYSGSFHELTPGVIFLNMFGAIILIYAYLLMSKVEASRRIVEQSSRTDPLTGLMNRTALDEVAAEMFFQVNHENARIVVMFADLDKFKIVNDTLGHDEGDRVLCAVSKIIQNAIRDRDLAARYGGDEFVLLLRNMTLRDAEPVAHRIQQDLAKWAEQNALDIGITICAGEAPTHGTSFRTLLSRLDRALYRSKFSGQTSGLSMVTPED